MMRCSCFFLMLVLLSCFVTSEAYSQRTSSATQTVTFAVQRPMLQQSQVLSTVAGGTQVGLPTVKSSLAQRKITATVQGDQESLRNAGLRDEERKNPGPSFSRFSMHGSSLTVSASPDHRPSSAGSNLPRSPGLLLTVTD